MTTEQYSTYKQEMANIRAQYKQMDIELKETISDRLKVNGMSDSEIKDYFRNSPSAPTKMRLPNNHFTKSIREAMDDLLIHDIVTNDEFGCFDFSRACDYAEDNTEIFKEITGYEPLGSVVIYNGDKDEIKRGLFNPSMEGDKELIKKVFEKHGFTYTEKGFRKVA